MKRPLRIGVIQFTKYAVVGLAVNACLFILYLLFTNIGLGHKFSMTTLYVAGVLSTFIFNRNWSFRDQGRPSATFIRYLAAYLSGYLINLFILIWLVDLWGFQHQWVQGAMIFLLAAYLFLAQKFWVFREQKSV